MRNFPSLTLPPGAAGERARVLSRIKTHVPAVASVHARRASIRDAEIVKGKVEMGCEASATSLGELDCAWATTLVGSLLIECETLGY